VKSLEKERPEFEFGSAVAFGEVKLSGAYVIVHPEGVYVGSAEDLCQRQYANKSALKCGRHGCPGLQEAYRRNPTISFKTLITNTRDEAYELETRLLRWHREHGFNVFNRGGDDARVPTRGVTISDTAKAQMRAFATGRKHSAETRRKISAGNAGKIFSEEARARMSAAQRARFARNRVV
jgi:NUMOD3 motif